MSKIFNMRMVGKYIVTQYVGAKYGFITRRPEKGEEDQLTDPSGNIPVEEKASFAAAVALAQAWHAQETHDPKRKSLVDRLLYLHSKSGHALVQSLSYRDWSESDLRKEIKRLEGIAVTTPVITPEDIRSGRYKVSPDTKPGRQKAIIEELRGNDRQLGEVIERYSALQKERKALLAELGREPTMAELYPVD